MAALLCKNLPLFSDKFFEILKYSFVKAGQYVQYLMNE